MDIQERMNAERADNSLYEKAHSYAQHYLNNADRPHIFPLQDALNALEVFDETFPKESVDAHKIIDQLHEYGAPATVAQLGGRYFGFVNGSVVPAGMAAKHIGTYWDQNSAMHVISPIVAKLESVSEKWLKEIFELPEDAVAGFVSGTSMANVCGLAAARFRILDRLGWDINEKGLFNAPQIRIVSGKHAHSSIIKSISLLGFGKANIEWVEVDDQGRMLVDQMPPLDDRTILLLQAGNVNSGSFDPIEEACQVARKANAWVHIDGAFGLWAAASNSLGYLTKGMNLANSWAVDGHKTLNTPYDSGIVMCSDKKALVSALHMNASYLILSKERDGMLYTPEMSRRARIIELWATLKSLGKEGLDEMITGMHHRAKQFGRAIQDVEGFELLNDIVFNQVIVKCATDELTDKVIAQIQDLRDCWVGGSSWFGQRVIRISVCSWATTAKDINIAVESFKKALHMSM